MKGTICNIFVQLSVLITLIFESILTADYDSTRSKSSITYLFKSQNNTCKPQVSIRLRTLEAACHLRFKHFNIFVCYLLLDLFLIRNKFMTICNVDNSKISPQIILSLPNLGICRNCPHDVQNLPLRSDIAPFEEPWSKRFN